MTGLFFAIFAGALLLGGCLITIICLSIPEKNELFISKEELFKHTETRKEILRNELLEYLNE